MANSFSSDGKVLAHILIVASKYVDWVDVNIIASDGFMFFAPRVRTQMKTYEPRLAYI